MHSAWTDLERFHDGAITGVRSSQGGEEEKLAADLRAGGAELSARPLQVRRQARQQHAAVVDRVVELLERDVEGGQRAFLDGAVLEAAQRIAQDVVGL